MKIATIGSGPIVHGFIDAINKVENVECTAVYSRKEETGRTLADKFDIRRVFTNLEEMFSADDIDFIYVASPNSLHFKQAKLALAYDKNVILEKPFTSTYAEAKELFDLAAQKNLFIFEAITTIHMPNFVVIKENLERIGNLRLVQCNYSQYSSKYDALLNGETPNVFNPEFSGGSLMDINIYNLHFILNLFGKPVRANYHANFYPNGIDTSGIVVIDYPEFKVTAAGAKDSFSQNFVLIQGEKGYIHVIEGANGTKEIEITLKDGTRELINNQKEENRLYYQLVNFERIYRNQDSAEAKRLSKHSLDLMKLLENLRRDSGLTFLADK